MTAADIRCPACGEEEDLRGQRSDDGIHVECLTCGQRWIRSLDPRCALCGHDDLQIVPVAIVEKGRGTQLSVVGIREVSMCSACDEATIRRWQSNRPNPLLPSELPTTDNRSFR